MSLTRRFHRLKKDDEIAQDVRAKLTAEHGSTGHCLVRVVVDRGVVYLTGSADSYARKWAIERVVTLSGAVPAFALLHDIERAVRSIPAVTRINNELLVA